jgi:hypothetical protein
MARLGPLASHGFVIRASGCLVAGTSQNAPAAVSESPRSINASADLLAYFSFADARHHFPFTFSPQSAPVAASS